MVHFTNDPALMEATEAISSTLGSDLMIGKEAINETDNMDAAHGGMTNDKNVEGSLGESSSVGD
jgi:hypothetical protein